MFKFEGNNSSNNNNNSVGGMNAGMGGVAGDPSRQLGDIMNMLPMLGGMTPQMLAQ